MTAYYNEIDPRAAEWLRELISAGVIADGIVDTRSIKDVTADDVSGFTQCHFFAGIGGWSYALRLAGWPDDLPVWTGSAPCQPFSNAGKRGGFDDDRHLWPEMFRLVRECRPVVCFGEQVASKDGLAWIDAVQADLEGEDYAVGRLDLCAAGIGAPHIRPRLYWVADGNCQRCGREQVCVLERCARPDCAEDAWGRGSCGLADAADRQLPQQVRGSQAGDGTRPARADAQRSAWRPGPTNGNWRDADWLFCRDAKWRPVEPGTFPLDHGIPGRVGRLRGYGNAIVPQLAAAFIEAYCEVKAIA